jgi:hypothetical protein
LREADAAKLLVRRGRFEAVALPDELDEAGALVDLPPEDVAHVALLEADNLLPERFVAEEGESIGDELTRAFQLLAHCGDEDDRPGDHAPSKAQSARGGNGKRGDRARVAHARSSASSGKAAAASLKVGSRNAEVGTTLRPATFAFG